LASSTTVCLFFGLWKFGTGEWTFLAGTICLIVAVTALLYFAARIENRAIDNSNRRIGVLVYTELILAGAAALFFALGKASEGVWANSVSMLLMSFVVLGPPVWFIVQPDLGITTFNVLSGSPAAPDDWKALSPIRRAMVYLGTLLFLAIGILMLVFAMSKLFSR
jgi:hypothetical protein